MSGSRLGKYLRFALSFVVPVLFHGVFDASLFNQGSRIFFTGPLVILLVVVLELVISRAKLIPGKQSLAGQNLRLEDWFLKYHQPRFERWILNSMGTPADIRVPLFRMHKSKLLWIISLLLFFGAWAALPFSRVITSAMGFDLGSSFSILLTTVYPVSVGASMVIVGIVNPDFFRFNAVRIPIIVDAVIRNEGGEENIISFDITPANCFLRSFEPLGSSEIDLYFEMKKFRSPVIKARPIWENHGSMTTEEPTGTIVALAGSSSSFYVFIMRYVIFRIWKGIVFNLKLPGFESIRRLFMSPATVMQKEVVYHPGATIFKQGDTIQTFYYIKKGEVQIIKELDSGEEIILEKMEAGQIFNEMSLLGDTRRTITARCVSRCVLAEAKADNLEALIKNDPDFALALILKLLNRVDDTQNSLTQTIEYLPDLIRVKDHRSRSGAILLSLLFGKKPKKGTIALLLKNQGMGGVSGKDLATYLKQSFALEDSLAEVKEKTEAIEKMINGLCITISHKE